mgnify:CR=1 FL=1
MPLCGGAVGVVEGEEGGGLVGAEREEVDPQRETRRVIAIERESEARRRELLPRFR